MEGTGRSLDVRSSQWSPSTISNACPHGSASSAPFPPPQGASLSADDEPAGAKELPWPPWIHCRLTQLDTFNRRQVPDLDGNELIRPFPDPASPSRLQVASSRRTPRQVF